jgi:hypothetical protein
MCAVRAGTAGSTNACKWGWMRGQFKTIATELDRPRSSEWARGTVRATTTSCLCRYIVILKLIKGSCSLTNQTNFSRYLRWCTQRTTITCSRWNRTIKWLSSWWPWSSCALSWDPACWMNARASRKHSDSRVYSSTYPTYKQMYVFWLQNVD